MSKSGLFAHFGSKQDLQLATVEEARQRYVREVIEPGLAADPGIRRLHALCGRSCPTSTARVPRRMLFASATAEFDAKAPGPVRDRIAECQAQWMDTLERSARDAQAVGELDTSTDPQQLAFELEAALLSANWYYHLYQDPAYMERARRAVRDRLASQATRTGLLWLPPESPAQRAAVHQAHAFRIRQGPRRRGPADGGAR